MNFFRYCVAMYFAVTAALVAGHIHSNSGDWQATLVRWVLISAGFCACIAVAAYVDKRWGS